MRLVIVGYGYSSRAIHAALGNSIDQLIVTCRTQAKADQLKEEGLAAIVFDGTAASPDLQQALCEATHLIMSAAPDEQGDPLLRHHEIADARCLQWVGYLSTVGVYGDHDGAWVDEASQTRPVSKRSIQRVAAEQTWQQRRDVLGISYSAFRLAGIYGRNRSALDKVRSGTARRIIKPGQVFNRIHVEDIGRVVAAAARSKSDGTFNVTDDQPCPPQDVVAYAAALLGVDPPDEISFEDANLSPMGRSFYGENKRVSNAKIKQAFGPLLYPSYREGLAGLMDI
ncbi:MAG: SDR family oxidoreductase [Hyphomicrobiales bacterium]